MHTHTYTHVHTCICIHIHIHMHVCTYIHVCTYTYIYIYTHTHTTCTYEHTQARLERRRGSDCARLEASKLHPSPCPLQSGRKSPSVATAQLLVLEERRISVEKPQPTAAHHTITTARHPDYTRSSVPVRDQSTRSMAALAAGHGDVPLLPFSRRFHIVIISFF